MNGWQKVGHHKGYLVRHHSALGKPEQRSAREIAREERLDARRREPLPYLDWERIARLAAASGMPLGGEIADVIERRDTSIISGGEVVAARRLVLYIAYDAEALRDLGCDAATVEEGLSDAINLTIHRDPANPHKLLATYGRC